MEEAGQGLGEICFELHRVRLRERERERERESVGLKGSGFSLNFFLNLRTWALRVRSRTHALLPAGEGFPVLPEGRVSGFQGFRVSGFQGPTERRLLGKTRRTLSLTFAAPQLSMPLDSGWGDGGSPNPGGSRILTPPQVSGDLVETPINLHRKLPTQIPSLSAAAS